VTSSAPLLAPDLDAVLRRLRLSAIRHLAPELLITSKTQRWSPEEFLRTLLEAEITSRDASNAAARLKLAGFPVAKTLEEFDVAQSSIPRATFDYLASLEWIRGTENLCLVGPAGTGKSHLLVALGHEAVTAGYKVRYFSAPALICLRASGPWCRVALALRRVGQIPTRAQHRGQSARSTGASRRRCHHERRVVQDERSPSERRSVLVKEEVMNT